MKFSDYHAINRIIHTYSSCADKGDFDGVGRLHDGVAMYLRSNTTGEYSEIHEPQEAKAATQSYAEMVRKHPPFGTPKTRHLIGNIMIEDDGPNAARAESYVVVFQATDKLPLQPIVAGTYIDKFKKVGGRWRLVERKEDMELIGNLKEHLLVDVQF
jgi:hypothetical protein